MIRSLRLARSGATSYRTRRALVAAIAATASTAALFAATGAASAATSSCAPDGTCTVSFAYTGVPESWTVPADVTSLTVTIAGASGGNGYNRAAGGPGGQFTTTIPTRPGEVLSVAVGGGGGDGVLIDPEGGVPGGAGGYGGGGNGASAAPDSPGATGAGGGGGSFLAAVDGTGQTLLAVAGGGGGTGSGCGAGGAGGAAGPGQDAYSMLPGAPDAGGGGTETGGGAAGGNHQVTHPGTGPASSTSAFGTGGSGDAADPDDPTFGSYPNGGGGGGYYGGGAGGDGAAGSFACDGSGGGGSGFLASGLAATATSTHVGDGFITITYHPVVPTPTATTLDTTAEPALVGGAVTYTASVFPVPPAGTVAFSDNADTIPGCGAAPVSAAGTATCTATYQSVGTHRITAGYSGAVGYTPSNSDTLTQQVAYGQQVLSYSASSGRGSVVAVGLRLTDTHGANLSAANVVVHAVSIDGVPVGHAVISGGSNFPYNRAIRGYTFIAWQDPPGLSKGQHTLRFTAGADPTTHAITFTAR